LLFLEQLKSCSFWSGSKAALSGAAQKLRLSVAVDCQLGPAVQIPSLYPVQDPNHLEAYWSGKVHRFYRRDLHTLDIREGMTEVRPALLGHSCRCFIGLRADMPLRLCTAAVLLEKSNISNNFSF
jgi:hypothetical protein